MSIETMMTLGVAGVIFVAALLVLGILTLVTRLSMLVLRPAARGTSSLARRHAPTVRATLVTWGERLATDVRERLVPAIRERVVPAVRERVVPPVRRWFTGDEKLRPALAPVRHRHPRP